MCILNIARAIKTMPVNEIKDFIFENYYKLSRFSKVNSYCLMKRLKRRDLLLFTNNLIEKIPDPRISKEHYQSLIKKKNTKSVKQSKIITYQPKTFENRNTVHIKSIITEHPKTSHKLFKTIRQAGKVGSNSSLYSDTKKVKIFSKKKIRNTKTKVLQVLFKKI